MLNFGLGTMQVVKPRPVQAASIPGLLGMFQIVRVFD